MPEGASGIDADDDFTRDVVALLPRFLGPLPEADVRAFAARLTREHAVRGTLLYRQGDASDCMHFVVTGRLEVRVRDRHGERRPVAHLSSGDCVGELSLLTGDARAADVLVLRDAVLARLARFDYEAMLAMYPGAGLNIARFALRTLRKGTTEFTAKVRNIVLVPLHPDVPIADFGRRLELALLRFGSTLYLDSTLARVKRRTADLPHSTEASDGVFIDRLLDRAERTRRFVISEADADASAWTRKCVAHADRVVFVADAAHSPVLSPIEQSLADATRGVAPIPRELVLVHANRSVSPSNTAAWLASRPDYRHAHVSWDGSRDFRRLARLWSGNAVTLVLGGGGARGLAQIGVIRAIREAGVPIDAVGGTSIGAIIGALVAMDWPDELILQSCKHAFVDDRPLDDLTVPVFSLLSGRKLARALHHYVGDVDIEDLWQPYFCISSNLSESRVHVHHAGRLWQAMQASAALPGLLPPTITDGRLFVDGGVLDNLPVGIMKRFIGGRTIAVEATVKTEYSVDAGQFPTPLEYLRARLSRRNSGTVPTLPSLLIKSSLLGGGSGRGELREGIDLHVNPPMHAFGFLDWDAIYAIVDIGYRHAQQCLGDWLDAGSGSHLREGLAGLPRESITA
ncbi:MAG TPA: patatin-like phospholipase family protein [Casimicrobiaceae bacterium]|nr:patatin-like phospholipase family protein [Casimicrobiaceae bacterium]